MSTDSAAVIDGSGGKLAFVLTAEQAAKLRAWVEATTGVEEDNPLPEFTVAFTVTGLGLCVDACRDFRIPDGTPKLVLQEL